MNAALRLSILLQRKGAMMPDKNQTRRSPMGGILPISPCDDPLKLARMTTDPIAANEVIEALVWKAIYYAKSADLYSAGPYYAQGNQQTFLDSVRAQIRLIAQHVLRARQEGYVKGEIEGRAYADKQERHSRVSN